LYKGPAWASFLPLHPYPEIPAFKQLRVTARRFPDNVAIIYKDKELTYRELDDLSDRLATALHDLE
jgi:non-ribosomal peptide synthetase component E (peptide arylation enzyme)